MSRWSHRVALGQNQYVDHSVSALLTGFLNQKEQRPGLHLSSSPYRRYLRKILRVGEVLRNPPATSPAHPLRAARYVERRAATRIATTTASSFPSAPADLAPLLSGLDSVLDLVLGLDGGVSDSLDVLLAVAPRQDAGDLDDADDAEEEVDGGEQVVLGLDDEAPARPDEAGGSQGAVLLQRELLGRAGEVGDAGEDEGPLCEDRRVS